MRTLLPLLLVFSIGTIRGENLIPEGNFESEDAIRRQYWKSFFPGESPNIRVVQPDPGKPNRALRGERSTEGGLVALSRILDKPQERIEITFSFAFFSPGNGRGRSLNLWTHEPDGKDASQFNLCIQSGKLMQFDGRTRTWETITDQVKPSSNLQQPVWHRLRAIVDSELGGIDYRVSAPGSNKLPAEPTKTMAAYRTGLPIAAIDFVSGTRIAKDAWYLIDDLVVRGGDDIPAPGQPEPLQDRFELWTGPAIPIPIDPEKIPFVPGMEHRTIHRPGEADHKFLHGSAMVEHKGVFYANWANSPVNENGPHETLRGRRSTDGGKTWGPLEIIGPGFEGEDRHSHGVLFVHDDRVWTICARFGIGTPGKKFTGLKGEAFVLNPATDRWESRGIVMENCWPYDEPVRMANGNFITGGQDKDGLPVVAISQGDDFTKWDSVLIPFHRKLAPSFAETTVWAEGNEVLAVIRGGAGVAWVAASEDGGRTWTTAQPSNLPMPRAKAYLGKLSTGQLYLISNLVNRDTLVISVGQPGEMTLNKMWRIRHGKSEAPRFEGHAKSRQWSYPYGYEHDGKLYVLYSIGKEECGLSVLPISSLVE